MASPVDVGGLPNHVKYCVSVLSLQWANIRTSPVGIPYRKLKQTDGILLSPTDVANELLSQEQRNPIVLKSWEGRGR